MTGLQWSAGRALSILGAGLVSQAVIIRYKDIQYNAGSVDTVTRMTVEKQRVPTHVTLNKLPSLPQALVRILDAVNQESADFQKLSDIIRQDTAMAARLIAVANSSLYRRQYSCDTVDRALMCLGLETVRTLVITAAVRQYFAGFNQGPQHFMRGFWQRSLLAAHSAQAFASLTGYQGVSQAYLSGLLMDVGQLCLLVNNETIYCELLETSAGDDQAMLQAERSVIGIGHDELGAAVLDSWRMDNFMAEAVRFHHAAAPDLSHAHHLVKLVNVANLLSRPEGPDEFALNQAYALFGFNSDLVQEIHLRVCADVQRLAGGLGIGQPESAAPADADPATVQLGQKVSELAQLQALRQGLSTPAGETPVTGGTNLGRLLYLSFGFEKHMMFIQRPESGALEAREKPDALLADFVVDEAAQDSLVWRSFASGQVMSSANVDPTDLCLTDQQLLRYCRQPDLLCMPFVCGHARGVLVAGADPQSLMQQQTHAALWRSLLNEIVEMLAAPVSGAQNETGQAGRQRISEAVHEASNPLSVINNYLEILRLKLGDSQDTAKEFDILREEIDRVGKILLQLNNPGQLQETERVDVNGVVEDLARIFRDSLCAAKGIDLVLELDRSVQTLDLNRAELKQVITNLAKNAVEAMSSGGTLTLGTQSRVVVGGRAHIAINIEDTGPGIDESVMARLFMPGTSHKGGQHAGLGLSVVKRLMDAMNAEIVCTSTSTGTQFRLLLPMSGATGPQSRQEN